MNSGRAAIGIIRRVPESLPKTAAFPKPVPASSESRISAETGM